MRRRQLEEAMDVRGSVAGDRVLGAGFLGMDLMRFGLPSQAAAMEEDDGVLELSLGLSIGGSLRKAGGTGAILLGRESGAGSGEAEADRRGSGASAPFSSSTPPALQAFQQGDLADGMDSQRQREMHAVRRQEARKTRHEKQQKKGSACRGRDGAALAATCEAQGFHGSSPPLEGACSADDRVALEAQEKRWRSRDREAREEEARHAERRAGENHELGSDSVPNPELCPNGNASPNASTNPNPSISPNFSNPIPPPFGAHPFPMMAMQYPYPHLQYVPMANGFGFPYMMPCWAPAMSSVAGGPNPASNVFQPVACRPFQPFSPPDVGPINGTSPLGSKVADLSGGNGKGIKPAPSRTGSLGSNSTTAISDYQSNSPQGGGSSGGDSGSDSSRAPVETSHPQLSSQVSNLVQGQSEHSISSPHVDPEGDAVEAASGKKRPSSNSTESGAKGDSNPAQCSPAKLEGTVSVNNPAPAAGESTPPPPPLPSHLRRMPCVSTTGNGPNGKTITGFLYRYTSTEVSIVCVCHGSSFSPAEFVEHAGGTDIDNPLKHIIVVPS